MGMGKTEKCQVPVLPFHLLFPTDDQFLSGSTHLFCVVFAIGIEILLFWSRSLSRSLLQLAVSPQRLFIAEH